MNVNEIASLGSNVKPVIQNENCAVLMLNDATGEGVMTVYRVMPGVMICFSDMYMEQCASEFYLYSFVAYLYELESGADCSDGCCCFSDIPVYHFKVQYKKCTSPCSSKQRSDRSNSGICQRTFCSKILWKSRSFYGFYEKSMQGQP